MNLRSILFYLLSSFAPTVTAWGKQQETIHDENGNEWAVIDYDPETKAAKFDRFVASSFHGDALDFQGSEVRNAAIVDSSIEGIQHLTVESIAIRQSSSSTGKNGHGPAIIDGEGVVSTSPHLRWDAQSKELKIPALGSFSQLEVRSDVDFNSHTLKNVVLEPGTELRELSFINGVMENSILRNVTAVDLNLGDIKGDTIYIRDFASDKDIGTFVTVAKDGKLEANSSMKSDEGQLSIDDDVTMSKSLQVSGEVYLKESLAVAGSVLGGGPYVDISDERYKRNVQDMNCSEVLAGLLQLRGVSYELDTDQMAHLQVKTSPNKEKQIGFIAQDVEELFPELVYNDAENDFKGLHYARFVPLLVESIKQLTKEVRELKEELNKQ